MNIVIAIDSFKGSCLSIDAALSIKKGIEKVIPNANIYTFPVADGGEGTVDAILSATTGKKVFCNVKNPIGKNIVAEFAVLENGTAVIEMAAASGLTLVSEADRNPLYTTTYGMGQLIAKALSLGCKKMILGIGGSATNDGGIGLATALGVKFRDSYGNQVGVGGQDLERIVDIDISDINPLVKESQILIASDVSNPLCGKNGAACVFAGQKGANDNEIARLDNGLCHYAKIIHNKFGLDYSNYPGAGAAGGVSVPLIAFCGAKISSGIELILDAINIENKLKSADLVITGEGMLDSQSIYGKAPVGVSMRAKKYNKPVIALVGSIGSDYEKVYDFGIDAVLNIQNAPMELQQSMVETKNLLEDCAQRVMRLYLISLNNFPYKKEKN